MILLAPFIRWLLAKGIDPRTLAPNQREMLRLAYEAERPNSATNGGPALSIKAAGTSAMPVRFAGGSIQVMAAKSCDKVKGKKRTAEEYEDDEEHDGPTRGAKDSVNQRAEEDGADETAADARDAEDEDTGPDKTRAALPTFKMLAYTGGAMKPMGWGLPIVVDLESVIVPKQQLPVPYAHDLQDPDSIIGHSTSIKVTTGATGGIEVEGVLSGAGKRADQVRALVKNDFPFQASIGADPRRYEFLEAGVEATVNGRPFMGPMYIGRNTVLGETSFVPLGADMNTSVDVAASGSQGKEKIMSFQVWLQARGKDESKLTAEERTALLASFQAELGLNPANPSVSGGGQITLAQIQAQADQMVAVQRQTLAAESIRCAAIKRICAGAQLPPEFEIEENGAKIKITNLEAHAIDQGWTPDKTELVKLRNGRNGVSPDGTVSAGVPSFYIPSKPEMAPQILEAAVLQALRCRLLDDDFYTEADGQGGRRRKAGISKAEQKRVAAQMSSRYTDQVQQQAHDLYRGRVGLHQVVAAGAELNGQRIGEVIRDDGDLERALRASFMPGRAVRADGSSMASLSNVLANVMNKMALMGYWMVEMAIKEICAVRSNKDFKPSKSINIWGDMEFQDIGPDDELTHGTISDQAFANQLGTSGRMGILPRQNLINDDLGMLGTLPLIVGRGAGLKFNKQGWSKFLNPGTDDGGSTNFFAAVHTISGQKGNSNYQEGSSTVLSSAGLASAELLFDNQVDPQGDPLGFEPEILLFSPDNKVTAWELLNSEFIVYGGGSAAKQPNKNRFVGAYRPVMSRYLNHTEKPYLNGSTTAWWLLADPGECALLEVVYLNGQEYPTVQTVQADFNRLGIAMRGFFDHGFNMQNFRGGVRSKGAA